MLHHAPQSLSGNSRGTLSMKGSICTPLLALLLAAPFQATTSFHECSWDLQCEELYMPGSKCMANRMCSNPFTSGCMNSFYSQYKKWDDDTSPEKRVCNSDDDKDSSHCERSSFNYPEIRVHNGNWESAIFYSWIIQIYLSEFLNVPVTVGLSDDTQEASFYNVESVMSWSSQAYAFDQIITANRMNGRCDLTNEPCVNVLPEVWIGQEKKWKQYLSTGHIDQVNGDGQIGKISWYIPTMTALRYPELVSFHGMAGRREYLADIFLRPTSWGEYCREESASGCLEPDDVATRAPELEEDSMYFSQGVFTGFFRPTDENNCTANPDTCTGHIVGAPCTWSTNVEAQAYHNDIALESSGPLPENSGYTYGQMIQIWRAANATNSDVVMWWWTPDATVEEFRGTPYEFQAVLLPEPTYECRISRIDPEDRCNVDIKVRQGNPEGGCDNEVNSLQTILSSSLRELSYNTPDVDRSPGYQAIRNLKVSHLDMNIMLEKWVAGGRSGYAAREAVCTWVVEHQDELQSFIPPGFPRTMVPDNSFDDPLLRSAMGFAIFSFFYGLIALVLVYKQRDKKVFVYAQVPFIAMLLLGLLLVACGSILFTFEPQDAICVSQAWFITLGYTLELVPLLVKVAAINRLVAATKRMRRVQIHMPSLFATVAGLVFVVIIALTTWTLTDPPRRTEGRYLTDDDDIVTTLTCAGKSSTWDVIVICWNGILIVCATVLAFQSRSIKQEFNDSSSLGTMIYSHFVLTVLYVVVWNVGGNNGDEIGLQPSTTAAVSSFLLSFDVVTAVTIYILPKIITAGSQLLPFADNSSHPSCGTSPAGVAGGINSDQSTACSGNSNYRSIRNNRRMMNDVILGMQALPSINEEVEEQSDSASGHFAEQIVDSKRVVEDISDSSTEEEDHGGPRFSRISATGSVSSISVQSARQGSSGNGSSLGDRTEGYAQRQQGSENMADGNHENSTASDTQTQSSHDSS